MRERTGFTRNSFFLPSASQTNIVPDEEVLVGPKQVYKSFVSVDMRLLATSETMSNSSQTLVENARVGALSLPWTCQVAKQKSTNSARAEYLLAVGSIGLCVAISDSIVDWPFSILVWASADPFFYFSGSICFPFISTFTGLTKISH